MKRLAQISTIPLVLILLSGCGTHTPEPSFEELCADQGGQTLSDSTTKLMTGMIYGTVIGSNGSVGSGSGLATSPITVTMNLCVVNGDVVDMELE